MGDPEEIGKKLAQIHKPWLGYLWRASRVLRILLLIWAVLYMILTHGFDFHGDAVLHETRYDPPVAVEPTRVELGGYTFRIVCAQVDDIGLKVFVRASSPRFWERIILPDSCITVVTADGQRFDSSTEKTPETRVIVKSDRWGIFYRDCRAFIAGAPCRAGDWVRVEMNFPIGTVELSAQVGEGRWPEE